jgi:perosamine synthetase
VKVEYGNLNSWPSWPSYKERELDAIARVIASNQLYAASEVRMFEEDFAAYQRSRHAIGVGNATQGLHLALAAAEIGKFDEVIVTPCSWISSASCVLMQNAVPIFVDIEPETLGINPRLVEQHINERTRAIIAVHVLGYPAKIQELRALADKYDLVLIEDTSHAPGAIVNGKMLGTYGDIGVFSLHQRKAISTGDGGVICTDNSEFADRLRKLRSFGHEELSYNYRMTEFAAALARLGLEKLDRENQKRIWAAHLLAEILKDEDWVKIRLAPQSVLAVYHAIAIELNMSDESVVTMLERLVSLGLPVRKLFSPLNLHPHFSNSTPSARGRPWQEDGYQGLMKNQVYSELDLPVTYEFCQGRVLELYAHPGVTEGQLFSFAQLLKSLHQSLRPAVRKSWSI